MCDVVDGEVVLGVELKAERAGDVADVGEDDPPALRGLEVQGLGVDPLAVEEELESGGDGILL